MTIYPEDAISHKSDLQEALRALKQSENAKLQAQLQQLQAVIEQMQAEAAEGQKAVDAAHRIAEENVKLKEAYAVLHAEATQKIHQANAVIRKLQADGMEVARDAQEFAEHIAAKEGVQVPTAGASPRPTE